MLVLVGKSGSGKTSVEDYLIKNHNFVRAISHTTRKKRVNDIDGVNYFFVSRDEMERLESDGQLAEKIVQLDNIYALVKEQCQNDRIVAVAPEGLKQLVTHNDLNILSIYLDVNGDVRRERMLGRGDSLESVNTRLIADEEVFDGVKDLVDVVIDNNFKTLEEVVEEILSLYKV